MGVKKLILCFLSVLLLFALCSCDSSETGVVIENKRVVALARESAAYLATIEYCEENGYSYVTYESISDAINAVDNGKAEYVVLESSEYDNSFFANDELVFHEQVEYESGYCAVFDENNESLYQDFNNAIKELREKGVLEDVKRAYLANKDIETPVKSEYKGNIKILCAAEFDGRVFYTDDGKLTGVDVAMVKAICKYLGYTPVFVEYEFDELFYYLEEGEGDLIFSAIEYTSERDEEYLLTDFYDAKEFNVYKRK